MKNSKRKTNFIKVLAVLCLFIGAFVLIKSLAPYAANGLIGGLFEENALKTESRATLNGNLYTLSEALELAKSGDTVYCQSATIKSEVTVPKNVTLCFEKSENGSVLIENGAKLIVNGKLSVVSKEDIISPYLESPPTVICNGEIVVNGVMDGYLPIEGDGAITVNGEICEPLFVADYIAAAADDCYKRGNLPFNQYFLNTLRVTRVINFGGRYTGVMRSGESFSFATLIAENGGLFNLSGGKIVLSYDKSRSVPEVASLNMGNVGKTTMTVYGNVSSGVTDFTLDKSYSTLNTFVAIPYCMDIAVTEGSFTVSENTKLKIMPGANFRVSQNGTLNVDGTLSVYDGLHIGEAYGVTYPDCEILRKNGFSSSGNLIVNGALNVQGSFYGTVQSETEGAVISIAENATLSAGLSEGFTTSTFSNLSVFTLTAKVYGLNDYVTLEKGKTYKSARISPFLLKNVVMEKVIYGSLHTEYYDKKIELNQVLTGRFLEAAGDDFTADVTFNIGERVKNVLVNLCGKNYYTDKEGRFTAKVLLNNFGVTYFTPDKDNILRSANIVFDEDTMLDSVVKNINLSENDYVIKDGIENTFYAVVDFYGGKTEKIAVFPEYDKTEDYVTIANFKNANYPLISNIRHEIYFYKQAFDDYKNAYNGLIDELSIKNSILAVYRAYIKLTENRTDKELSFINSVLSDFRDFSFVTDILPSVITYGDKTARVTAVFVDGSKNTQTVTLSDYAYVSGDITVKAEYRGVYKGISYTVEKVFTNVQPKKVTYAIDGKSGTYLDQIKPLTGRCISGEFLEDGVITLFTTARQNSPVGNYAIMGKCESPYYLVTFANANYEIRKKPVSVKIEDKTITLSESGNLRFDYENDFGAVIGFTVTDGTKSVIIDLSGNLSDSLQVGVYSVTAIFDENFIAESNKAVLTVLQDDNKYSVDFGFRNGGSKVYDGNEFTFTVTAVDKTDPSIKLSTEVSIEKDGNAVSAILNAGNYVVCVKVYERLFFQNFTVKPCPVNLAFKNIVVYYGDHLTEIEFTSSLPVEKSEIKFWVEGETIAAESANPNYIVNSVTGTIKTLPRPITVRCEEKSKFYGDSDEALSCTIVSGSLASWDSINKIVKLAREPGETVGSYEITADRINDNYNITVIPSNYVILPRNITVTANTVTAVYGETFELSASVTKGSLKADDDLDGVVRLYRAEGNAVGVYPVQAELRNSNYNVTYVGATAEILPLNLTVTMPNLTAVYGDNIELTAYTSTKIPYGLTLKDVVFLEREEGDSVGDYKIYARKINDNFSVEFDFEFGDHSIYTVVKREITVELSDLSAEFTEDFDKITQSVAYTITSGNLIEGDNLELEFCAEKEGVKVDNAFFGKPSVIGDYDLVIVACNPNYSVKSLPAKLHVTKKQLWLKDILTDFTYTGQPLNVFDISKNVGGLDGLDVSGFTVTVTNEDGNIVSLDKVINAGKYTVTVSADENLYKFLEDSDAYIVTVEKADISESIVVESEYEKFTVIGKNRPIARLLGYNCNLVTEFYYGVEAVDFPNKEGEYLVKVSVADDNYKGEVIKAFTACKDISPEIEKISKLLDEIETNPSLKMTNLLKIKETVAEFSEGENYQIDKISAYKSVIDDYLKVYNEFYESEKQSFDTSIKVCFDVNPVDLALGALSLFVVAILKNLVKRRG